MNPKEPQTGELHTKGNLTTMITETHIIGIITETETDMDRIIQIITMVVKIIETITRVVKTIMAKIIMENEMVSDLIQKMVRFKV